MPDLALPSTSAFPSDPSELERAELEMVYLQLRSTYRSLMLSRGQYRGRAHRQEEQIREQSLQQFERSEELIQLRETLNQTMARESKLKAETYAMLEAMTELMEQLEDAGDELSRGFGAYQLGKRRPGGGGSSGYGTGGLLAGGASLPQLMKGVLHFLSRWRLGKQRFQQLMHQRETLNALLENRDG